MTANHLAVLLAYYRADPAILAAEATRLEFDEDVRWLTLNWYIVDATPRLYEVTTRGRAVLAKVLSL